MRSSIRRTRNGDVELTSRMRRLVHLCLISGAISHSVAEGGQPIFNPENGHFYEVVTDQVLWPEAKAAAEARVIKGSWGMMYGHLATITSESENNFIVENVMNGVVTSAYFGGFQPGGSQEPGCGWRCVNEEPFA